MAANSYKDLRVWQKSFELCNEVYIVTKNLPIAEQFGLVQQIRRCAVSIPSNIAEGFARKSTKDYIRFLRIAYGSLAELETQLLIVSVQYKSKPNENVEALILCVKKMLNKLITVLSKAN